MSSVSVSMPSLVDQPADRVGRLLRLLGGLLGDHMRFRLDDPVLRDLRGPPIACPCEKEISGVGRTESAPAPRLPAAWPMEARR